MQTNAKQLLDKAFESLELKLKAEQAILAARSENESIYNLRVLCSDQELENRRLETQILQLQSKVGYLETQLDKARPPAIRPVDAITVMVPA